MTPTDKCYTIHYIHLIQMYENDMDVCHTNREACFPPKMALNHELFHTQKGKYVDTNSLLKLCANSV